MSSGLMTFPRTILQRAFTSVRIEITRSADWREAWALREGEKPLDLTGCGLEWTIRPDYEHPTTIYQLGTGAGGGIIVDEPRQGAFYVSLPQARIEQFFLSGTWTHVLILLGDPVSGAPTRDELFRGAFIVHPGRR